MVTWQTELGASGLGGLAGSILGAIRLADRQQYYR
jgi:hypothetical protein